MWDTQVDSLIENACYKMEQVAVCEFNSVNSLSAGVNSTFVEVEDIGEVQEPDSDSKLESTSGTKMVEGL